MFIEAIQLMILWKELVDDFSQRCPVHPEAQRGLTQNNGKLTYLKKKAPYKKLKIHMETSRRHFLINLN